MLPVFHPTGHALAATAGTVKPHGDVDAATNTTMDRLLWSNVLQLFQGGGNSHPSIHDATTPGHEEDYECLTEWNSNYQSHLNRLHTWRTSVLEQNQGSATKHPIPQGLISQTYLLGHNPKAVQEVPTPQVNHLAHAQTKHTSANYFLILLVA